MHSAIGAFVNKIGLMTCHVACCLKDSKHAWLCNIRCDGAGEAADGWHDSKVALLSAAAFAAAAGAMTVNAYLSQRAQEWHCHGCLPVLAVGLCIVCIGCLSVSKSLSYCHHRSFLIDLARSSAAF